MRTTLAVLDKSGDNAKKVVGTVLESFDRTELERIGTASPQSLKAQKGFGDIQSKTAGSSAVGSISSTDESTIVEFENAALSFQGRIYSPMFETSPLATVAAKVSKEREKAIEEMISNVEGDFALIIAEPGRIIVGRDSMGAQPLYYGENSAYAALGSNRRVLWRLGMRKTQSFPPGHLGWVTKKGIRLKSVRTLSFSEPKQITMQLAADTLLGILERSVQVRVQNEKEIAVAFSGGLDSSLVAVLAKKCNVEVQLVQVSLVGQSETEEAKKAADELNLPLDVYLFREEEVANVVAKVVELIEEPDPVKTAIGIPFYWVAQKAAEKGFRVLLAGHGADELFGGYQRYVNGYCFQGEKKARRTMFADITGIHESNLERDKKICNFHNVELRLPFVSYEIAKFATRLPIELKMDCRAESLRKLVLRRVAENVGLPTWIAKKPKKAMQYATGTSSALRKLAGKRKTTTKGYIGQLFRGQETISQFQKNGIIPETFY